MDLRTLSDGDVLTLWSFRYEGVLGERRFRSIPEVGTFRALGQGPEGWELTGPLGGVTLFQNAFPTRRALIESRIVRARGAIASCLREIGEMAALLQEEEE